MYIVFYLLFCSLLAFQYSGNSPMLLSVVTVYPSYYCAVVLSTAMKANHVRPEAGKCCRSLWPALPPRGCSPPGSSVQEMFQARIPERIVVPFSRGSPRPRAEPEYPALQAYHTFKNPCLCD